MGHRRKGPEGRQATKRRTAYRDPLSTSTHVNSPEAIRDIILFTVGLQRLKADPLKHFKWKSEASRIMLREICKGNEAYWRAGNSSGKTYAGAAIGIAMLRGLRELDGEPLPEMPIPNVGWVISQTYKAQMEASQKAYLRWLGGWPKYISYVQGRGKGYIERIYVATPACQHGDEVLCETCSQLVFHCEEGNSTIGGRIDWAHGDEPPKEDVWREVRSRKQSGRSLHLFITATPLEYQRWDWLKRDFQSECLVYASPHIFDHGQEVRGQAFDRLAEIRSTMYDNLSLTDGDIEFFESKWKKDQQRDARFRGEYVNLTGLCPFNEPEGILDTWMRRCHEPKHSFTLQVQSVIEDTVGRDVLPMSIPVECWNPPDPSEKYLIIIDPSGNRTDINARKSDPTCLHVYARIEKRLVARVNGNIPGSGIGVAAAMLARKYNKAVVDFDRTGGYWYPVMAGLNSEGYRNISQDVDADKIAFVNQRLGFTVTKNSRGEIVGSIKAALWEDAVVMPSRAVIDCLKGVIIDPQGKWQAAPGLHDDDMICMGRALYLMGMLGTPKPKETSAARRFFEQRFGRKSRLPQMPQPRLLGA